MGIYDVLLKTEPPAKREQEQQSTPEPSSAPSPTPPRQAREANERRVGKQQADPQKEAVPQTRTRARTHASVDDLLERVVSSKRHLTSYTFRFSSQELDDLDRIKEELNADREADISKNDVVRLAIHVLLKQLSSNK